MTISHIILVLYVSLYISLDFDLLAFICANIMVFVLLY